MELIVLKELLLKQKQFSIRAKENPLEIMKLELKTNHQNHRLIVLQNNLKKVKTLKVNHNKKVNKNKKVRRNKQLKMKENNLNNQQRNSINISTLNPIENNMMQS